MRLPMSLRGGKKDSTKGTENRFSQLLAQAVATQEDGFKKSKSDTRSYKHVVLPNKLEAVVVSDPKIEMAAAALSVNVGSYSDPVELPGLAHFLEHMLFMGTEKYPDENEYSKFLSENGGYSNAYTASEETNYQFQIISGQLEGALDRFAQFFVKPLLSESGAEREVKAVDNECSGNEQNDGWRGYLIYRELAHKHHPVHKFNIGNYETLYTTPKENGINVREALLKFYEQHYSADRMKLVVVGKESLEELEQYVQVMFSNVPNKNRGQEYVYPFPGGPAFDEKNLKKLIKVVPVKDIRKIELEWILPRFTIENKRKEAARYLGSLLGDEGEGSILSYLKKKSWANALSAGTADDNFDMAAFQVTIHCTDLGITKHVNDIIGVVYSYINMLHKVFENESSCRYFFEEEKIMSAIGYWFESDKPPMRMAISMASNLHEVPVKDIMFEGRVLHRETFQEVKDILADFIPENSLVFLSLKANEPEATNEEEFFKTKYSVSSLPDELVHQWKNAVATEEMKLALTIPNKFIPSSFDVAEFQKPKIAKLHSTASSFLKNVAETNLVTMHKTLQHSNVEDKIGIVKDKVERDLTEVWEDDTFRRPVVIASDEFSTVWLKQDTTFKKPKCNVYLYMRNPVVNESLFSSYATNLYITLMDDTLNEETYAASSAGFSHSMYSTNNGVVMAFTGFAETLHKYVELVTSKFKAFLNEKVEDSLFQRFHELVIKGLLNQEKARPVGLARQALNEATLEKSSSIEERLKVARALTLKEIMEFAPKIFENVSLEILVTGNAASEDAHKIHQIALETFKPKRPVSDVQHLKTVNLQEKGRTQIFHIEHARNPENKGSGICIAFQFGERTDLKVALLSVFSEICHEQCFNKLRTEQSLGYIVSSGFSMDNGILSIMFYIESNSADPITLNSKVEEFIDHLEKSFDDLFNEKTWPTLLNSEINSIISRSQTLGKETSRWFGSISGGLYTFENGLRVCDAFTTIQPEDLKKLLNTFMFKDAPQRAKFVSGMLADPHGVKLFGEKYGTLKPKEKGGIRQGFDEKFIKDWFGKEGNFDSFVKDRGEVVVVEDLVSFKANSQFHPSYADILAKL